MAQDGRNRGHDWEGYIRVPEDGTYNFTIQIDDNGYLEINGER